MKEVEWFSSLDCACSSEEGDNKSSRIAFTLTEGHALPGVNAHGKKMAGPFSFGLVEEVSLAVRRHRRSLFSLFLRLWFVVYATLAAPNSELRKTVFTLPVEL